MSKLRSRLQQHLIMFRSECARLLILLAKRLDPKKVSTVETQIQAQILPILPIVAAPQETVMKRDVEKENLQYLNSQLEEQIAQVHLTFSELRKVFSGSEWSKLIRNARDGGASSILASQVLAKTARLLEYGLNNVLEMTNAAEDVKNASRYLATISDDIKLISNQSRIVSINASIEANRAGDHGRTFQVVAHQMTDLSEDVRKLTLSIDSSLVSVNQKIDLNKELCGKVGKLFTNLNGELEEFRKQMMRVEELSILQLDQLKVIEVKLTKEVADTHQNFKQSPNRQRPLVANL